MPVIIEARRLRKVYGGAVAVRDVSLEVNEGEFLSLLGASGSGKTTLLRMIAGLEQPTSGQVFCAGEDITHLPAARRNMRMVFQDFALFPNLTVYENVAFGLRLRIARGRVTAQDIDARVGRYLETVQLSAHADKLPHQLSGGQKQRVSLARALVTDPPVVLFDEPLGSLDANMRKAMQIELKRLHRELRKTFIYVTHDQEEAMGMSDRVAVLADGGLLQLASPEAIYARPDNVAVARFFGSANVLTGTAEQAGDAPASIRIDGGARFILAGDALAATGHARGPVTVMVRAEHLQVAAPGSRMANAFAAQVTERLFLGDKVRYELALPGSETRLTAITSIAEGRFAVGDAVEVTADPAYVRVIREAAPGSTA